MALSNTWYWYQRVLKCKYSYSARAVKRRQLYSLLTCSLLAAVVSYSQSLTTDWITAKKKKKKKYQPLFKLYIAFVMIASFHCFFKCPPDPHHPQDKFLSKFPAPSVPYHCFYGQSKMSVKGIPDKTETSHKTHYAMKLHVWGIGTAAVPAPPCRD